MIDLLRRLKGLSIEFNRQISSESEISISEYLIDNDGIPFCHISTYRKMQVGEYSNISLYDEMMKKKNMEFQYIEEVHSKLKDKYLDIKRDIEFSDITSLSKHLKEGMNTMSGYEDIYPHKMEYYILEQLERFYVKEEILDDRTIKILSWTAKISSTKHRAILIHLIYFNTHKKKKLTSSLKAVFESLPLFDKDELLIALVIIRQMIYEKEYDVALSRASKFEKICLQSRNYPRLAEIYQDMIAIYGGLDNEDKSDDYIKKLNELINDKDKLNEKEVYRSRYYLGMCSYTLHDYEKALEFFQTILKIAPNSYSTKLFYLSVISYLEVESKLKADDINLDDLDVTNKVFLRYFIYKLKGRSKKELVSYIVNKIMPILSSDYSIEANIFRQELYLLGAEEEFLMLSEQMNMMKCVILQNWDEVLEKR